MNTSRPKPERSYTRWAIVILAYLATLGGVMGLVFYTKARALSAFATPAAQQQWNEWREAADRQTDQGPVRRRPPKSAEPPSLVLLRDHFLTVLVASLVFTTALYATLVLLVRGALTRSNTRLPGSGAASCDEGAR